MKAAYDLFDFSSSHDDSGRGKGETTLSLYELNALVREVLEKEMAHEYWVEAELSEARESKGHCYMELIEKDGTSNTPIARASAKCWRSQWAVIQPHFERVTGQRLHTGMKVRLKVYAQFHEAYGFSWIVTDIDPNYTLGDMARRRQEIIAKLKQEGIFDMQKELELPLFCLNIAVISSESAAGYGDFCHQLADSGFAFRTELFPAVMQGEQVEQSIIQALNTLYNKYTAETDSPLSTLHSSLPFDCVVIIRGGGATSDMSGFDTLALAENVAQFPLPIITGIGHDRDECILDMVSYLRVKTPTAAAAFLIDRAQQVLDRIRTAEERLAHEAQARLSALNTQFTALSQRIPTLFSLVKTRQEARLEQDLQRIATAIERQLERGRNQCSMLDVQCSGAASRLLTSARHGLELIEQRVNSLDPQLLLKRGYSITTVNGRLVKNAADVRTGDEIETTLKKGTIKSIVK